MDVLIAFVLLVIAVFVLKDKTIKIEIMHRYPELKQPDHLADPNKDGVDPEVTDAVAQVIATLNNIMTGGDLSGSGNKQD